MTSHHILLTQTVEKVARDDTFHFLVELTIDGPQNFEIFSPHLNV